MLVKLYLTIIGIIKQIDSNMSKLMKRAIRYKHTDHNYRKVLLKKILERKKCTKEIKVESHTQFKIT